VVKISLWPERANCSIERSASGLADVLQIGGLDPVAERFDERLATEFMLIGPAEIADRPDIDESDLQFVGGGGTETERGRR
jgi:hypothetical protein